MLPASIFQLPPMLDSLLHAYTPLVLWSGLGLLLVRFLPDSFPRFLGQALYWVGVPLQLFALARQTELSAGAGMMPLVAIGALLLSIALTLLIWWAVQWVPQSTPAIATAGRSNWLLRLPGAKALGSGRATLGSFMLAAMLGNTGFIGLALTEILIPVEYRNWAILFSVASNVVGNYGLAVFIASYFGHSASKNHWWIQARDVLTVPSLWAFFIGFYTRSIPLPDVVELALGPAIWVVIASALLLVGLRLGTIKGWRSLERALWPMLLKVAIVPGLIGLGATLLGVVGDPRLVLVLMSGTPTGLSVLILAEVYDLDRELLSSSIALTFIGMLLVLPVWLTIFG